MYRYGKTSRVITRNHRTNFVKEKMSRGHNSSYVRKPPSRVNITDAEKVKFSSADE